jgi:hypothetical protein
MERRQMTKLLLLAVMAVGLAFVASSENSASLAISTPATCEFATVRWAGDRTSIIWPDGTTDRVIAFGGRKRPMNIDEKAWCLTGAMNIIAKRGFDFVQMNNDDLIMKRPASSASR